MKTASDESKLKTIESVLSKIDVDRDGHVKVDDVLKVCLHFIRKLLEITSENPPFRSLKQLAETTSN